MDYILRFKFSWSSIQKLKFSTYKPHCLFAFMRYTVKFLLLPLLILGFVAFFEQTPFKLKNSLKRQNCLISYKTNTKTLKKLNTSEKLLKALEKENLNRFKIAKIARKKGPHAMTLLSRRRFHNMHNQNSIKMPKLPWNKLKSTGFKLLSFTPKTFE